MNKSRGKSIEVADDKVYEIRDLYSKGLNRIEIAELSGITEHCVRKVLKGFVRSKTENAKFVRAKKEIILSEAQKQCMFGTLLGDASLSYREKRNIFEYQVSHCLAQKEYTEHIAHVLGTNVHCRIKDASSYSAGKQYYSTNFSNALTLEKLSKTTHVNNKKMVNKLWVDSLGPEGMAYWFMDDGSSTRYGKIGVKVALSTLSFSVEEISLLINRLSELGVKSTMVKHSKKIRTGEQQYEISIKSESVNSFFDIVEPYMVPCMKYKIKRKVEKNEKIICGREA